ncbi:MAG TPA: DUF1015 domain-containing protein, partial [candidate division Zixibacteria bacterium]|nr:DUF1015 domain-containing protein [candidate division Zixibacteria bacterium]
MRPFRGLRPRPDLAGQIAAPPYDVLTSDEARERVKNNPLSFLRVNKPEINFPPDTPGFSKEVFLKGKKNLEAFIANKQMLQDKNHCFYLHRLEWREKSMTGLVALCSLDEYESGVIKKHERTRPDKVNDRAEHIMTVGAQVGPVMLAFRTQAEIARLFDELCSTLPNSEFTSDDVNHRVWVIDSIDAIERLKSAFDKLPNLY